MKVNKSYWIGFGDVHDEPGNISAIPELADADGVIISGDLTTRGGAAGAAKVLEAARAVNPRVHAQIGNMDGPEVDAYLSREGVNLHLGVVELAPGLGMMGVGWSTPTPFGTPSEVDDATIGAWLEQAYAKAGHFERLLLVAHNPPHGTAVDKLGPGMHVGSHTVRAFIERVQPEMCLTGHIHEAGGMDRLGRTLVVNPGPMFLGGYAVIRFDGRALDAEIKRV